MNFFSKRSDFVMRRTVLWLTITFFSLIISTHGMPAHAAADSVSPFKRQVVMLGYANRNWWNPDIPRPPSPLFWRASTHANQGVLLLYLHRITHTRRFFGVNWGASFGNWWHQPQHQMSASAFFDFRFWPWTTTYVAPYFEYSVAGITLLSKQHFAGSDLGTNLLFEDFMGAGVRLGRHKHIELGLKLVHYSNGDIFTKNPGFDVPLVMMLGYAY